MKKYFKSNYATKIKMVLKPKNKSYFLWSLFIFLFVFSLSFSSKIFYPQSAYGDGLGRYNWVKRTSSGPKQWMNMASSADGSKLIASCNQNTDNCGYGIYTSTDNGTTWTGRAIQTTLNSISATAVASSADGSKLALVNNGEYVYTSTDSGATWTRRTGAGILPWRDIASSADGMKLAITADNPDNYIYTSTDGGATWVARTSVGKKGWGTIASSADGTKLVAAAWAGGYGNQNNLDYIYTSIDSGATWTQRTSAGRRGWSSVASSADGTKLAAVYNLSWDSADQNSYIYTSTDGGTTWTQRMDAGSNQRWYDISSSDDGAKLVALSTDGIYTSIDGGITWQKEMALPSSYSIWQGIASSADGTKLVSSGGYYIYTTGPIICGNSVIDTGEVCDGTNLNNQTCQTKGFSGGTLQCGTDCQTFNTTSCSVGNCTKIAMYGTSDIYLYINSEYRKFVNDSIFLSYGYLFTDVVTAYYGSFTPIGSSITTPEDGIRTACPGHANTCTDTDGGSNFNQYGTATLKDSGGNILDTKSDICSGSSLTEYYCQGTQILNTNASCSYGCENGACKSAASTCTDTDGGQIWDVNGYTSNTQGYYYQDKCLLRVTSGNNTVYTPVNECSGDDCVLQEGYCTGPDVNNIAHSCANGCLNGACKPSTTATCGDGVKNGTEQCDKTDLGGATCLNMGYTGGTLACSSNCNWTFANCEKNNVTPQCDSPLTNFNYLSGFSSGDTLNSLIAAGNDIKLNQLISQTITNFGNHEFALPNLYQKLIGEDGCTWMEHYDTGALPDSAEGGCYIYSYVEGRKVSVASDESCNNVASGQTKMLKAIKDGYCCGEKRGGDDRLTPAKTVKGEDNQLILQLNRLISALEQRVIDLETRLTTAINRILTNRLRGYLIIQPEANGEVWYTSPETGERFYVADGQAAYGILSGMGQGITGNNLKKVPIGYDPNLYGGALTDTDDDSLPDVLEQAIGTDPASADTDGDGFDDLTEVMGSYNPNGDGKTAIDKAFAKKLKGIYLDVDNRGAAWYINPKDFKRYYVSPETAYNVMKYLSLGVANKDLRQIPVGEVSE